MIILIAIIYKKISKRVGSTVSPTSEPEHINTINNNSLADDTNINNMECLVSEITVIPVQVPFSYDLQESVVTSSDQCPDVVGCAKLSSRPRHVFIRDGNNVLREHVDNKWIKNASVMSNCTSLDDIRLYSRDAGLKVWATTASASMEFGDEYKRNIIQV